MNATEFEQYVLKLRPRLVAEGNAFFGSRDAAEDVAQEILLRLWSLRDKLDAERNVEALAVRMAHNYCVDQWRKTHVRQFVDVEEAEDEISSSAGPQEQLEANEAEARVAEIYDRLPNYQSRLLRMRFTEQMELETIAKLLDSDVRTVSTLLSRAKKQFMRLYYETERE